MWWHSQTQDFRTDVRFENIEIWMCVMAPIVVLVLNILFEVNVTANFSMLKYCFELLVTFLWIFLLYLYILLFSIFLFEFYMPSQGFYHVCYMQQSIDVASSTLWLKLQNPPLWSIETHPWFVFPLPVCDRCEGFPCYQRCGDEINTFNVMCGQWNKGMIYVMATPQIRWDMCLVAGWAKGRRGGATTTQSEK